MQSYINSAAKSVGAHLLECLAPKNTDAGSGKKNFETAARSLGRQTLRKQLGSGSKKGTASGVIPSKFANKASWLLKDFR